MRFAFKDYLYRVGKIWWAIVIGFAFGLIGAAKDMTGWDSSIPTWVWWVGFGVTLLVANFLAYWSLYKEQHHEPSKYPDMKFCELVRRVTGIENSPNLPIEQEMIAFTNLLTQIRERAAVGQIQIWGRKSSESLRQDAPRVLIPIQFWALNEIDQLESLKDCDGATEAIHTNTIGDIYRDLAFSRQQVIPLWPKPKYRLRLSWPIRIERSHGIAPSSLL